MTQAEPSPEHLRAGEAEEPGGEAACALHRVCDACGALEVGPPTRVCGRCGSVRPG